MFESVIYLLGIVVSLVANASNLAWPLSYAPHVWLFDASLPAEYVSGGMLGSAALIMLIVAIRKGIGDGAVKDK